VRQIEEIRVDLDPAERQAMMGAPGRRTVPQIFIGDTHVGGATTSMPSTSAVACCPCCRRWFRPTGKPETPVRRRP
jgi:hypothetical protein